MLELKDIKPGTVLVGPKWNEPVRIKSIDNDGSYVHIVGTCASKDSRLRASCENCEDARCHCPACREELLTRQILQLQESHQ